MYGVSVCVCTCVYVRVLEVDVRRLCVLCVRNVFLSCFPAVMSINELESGDRSLRCELELILHLSWHPTAKNKAGIKKLRHGGLWVSVMMSPFSDLILQCKGGWIKHNKVNKRLCCWYTAAHDLTVHLYMSPQLTKHTEAFSPVSYHELDGFISILLFCV